MIESLGEHGVDPSDLVPALMTTHTVKNPEYDPVARKRKEMEAEKSGLRGEDEQGDLVPGPPAYQPRGQLPKVEDPTPLYTKAGPSRPMTTPRRPSPSPNPLNQKSVNPFGDDDEVDLPRPSMSTSSSSRSTSTLTRPTPSRLSSFDADDDEGDIGRSASPSASRISLPDITLPSRSPSTPPTPTANSSRPLHDPEKTPSRSVTPAPDNPEQQDEQYEQEDPEEEAALPSLPGVSTTMSTTDEMITLDIRWTVVR